EAKRAVFEVGVEGDPVRDLCEVPAAVVGSGERDGLVGVGAHGVTSERWNVSVARWVAPRFEYRGSMGLGFIPSRPSWECQVGWSEPVSVCPAPGGLVYLVLGSSLPPAHVHQVGGGFPPPYQFTS